MTTPLTKPLKRELQIQGRPFVVTLSPEGIKLLLKGKRKGQELRWEDLVSGEAALAVALNASLKGIPERRGTVASASTGASADQPSTGLPKSAAPGAREAEISNSSRGGSSRKRLSKRKSSTEPKRP